ncbi:HEPN domain-containing protein [Maribacter sp. Asnod2-G09]|uniref:ApeA N-terminal domain 1-containing protein n=1 Tax=Maribacter sp. Asnod2-G09 TaxID=3160577 RepID=UPI0038654DCC
MQNYIGKIVSPYNNEGFIDSVRLSLSQDTIEIEFPSTERNFNNIKTIIGVFNGIGKITLVNCQNTGRSSGAGGVIKKYNVEYLFKGGHIHKPESIYFDNVNIKMSGLLDWTKISSLNFDGKDLYVKDVDRITIYKSDNYTIEIFPSHNISLKREFNEINFTENITLKISSLNKDINVWDYLHLIKELKKILFILTNRDTKIDDTTFNKKEELSITLFWPGSNSLGSPSYINPKITFDDIRLELNEIIHNWFDKKDLHTSIELILEKTINTQLSHENYFLNNCFAIETLHRRFNNYKLFDKSEFKSIKGSILKSIENDNLRKLIENNLAHINEPNFRNRLTNYEADFSQLLPENENAKDYISKIVKTRNYLVHRGSCKDIFEEFDMLYASFFIETIVKINVYRILGLKNKLIEKLLIETGERINSLYQSNNRMRFED